MQISLTEFFQLCVSVFFFICYTFILPILDHKYYTSPPFRLLNKRKRRKRNNTPHPHIKNKKEVDIIPYNDKVFHSNILTFLCTLVEEKYNCRLCLF